MSANNCFRFSLSGPSLCAIVDFLVLEVFNSSNVLSEEVVGLKLFYPKSFQKQFCTFLKAPKPLLLHKFYVRTGVKLTGLTCENEIRSRDDVWTAYVNFKFSTFYVYVRRSYIVSNFIYAPKASEIQAHTHARKIYATVEINLKTYFAATII